MEKQTKTSHESLGYRILATRYFHTRFVGNYSPAQSAQPSLASPAQPSAGLRRRNFHTFSTFHSFYNNLTLTQTPHRRLYSGKMGTEIVFPPILTIFLYFDLIVLTRQIATFADAESPLFGSVQTFNGAIPAPARGEKY